MLGGASEQFAEAWQECGHRQHIIGHDAIMTVRLVQPICHGDLSGCKPLWFIDSAAAGSYRITGSSPQAHHWLCCANIGARMQKRDEHHSLKWCNPVQCCGQARGRAHILPDAMYCVELCSRVNGWTNLLSVGWQ